MGRLAANPYVTQLHNRLRAAGMDVRPEVLEKVLNVKGADGSVIDVDMAVTAFQMKPRPSWLLKILGPMELHERPAQNPR